MCDKKFTTIFNLRDHERRHTKNYTCYCPYCPEKTVGFYKQVYLNQHVKKVHPSSSGIEKKSRKVPSDDDSSSSDNNSQVSGTAETEVLMPQAQSGIPFRHEDQTRQDAGPSYPCLSLVQPSASFAEPQQFIIEG